MNITLQSALWGIGSARWRSGTILITVMCAVSSVFFCAAIIGGFDDILRRMSFGRSAFTLTIRANEITNERVGPPSLDDLTFLRQAMPRATEAATWTTGRAAVRFENGAANIPVYGVLGQYRSELDTPLASGRWFTETELEENARVCLLGSGAADQLGDGATVGRTLHLSGVSCEIIGVLRYPDTRPARRFVDAAILPFQIVKRYFGQEDEPRRAVSWLTLFFPEGEDMAAARTSADTLLRKRHGVPQTRLSPYLFDDPEASVRDQERQRNMVARLLASITAIVILVSVICYCAVTIAACQLRRREFAIRMAMGALRHNVARQIIIENLILTIAGSFLGVACGYLLALVASSVWDWPIAISWRYAAALIACNLGLAACIGSYGGWLAGSTPPASAAR